MKKIDYLIITACMIFIGSCNDFLDVKPTNSAASETAITGAKDAQVFLNGIMSKMTSADYYGRNMFIYGDAKGGDLALESQGRGMDDLYSFNQSPTSSSFSGYWQRIYHCILQINTLLQNVEKMINEGSSAANLNSYKAQALTLRALMYFDLVRLYGKPYNMDKSSYGVPLALEPLDASAQPTRASVEEVYNQIVKDLKDAEPIISKTKTNGYINYYGNLALQARVYLYMERYADALTAAETIINSNVYTLYTNENWVNSWKSQFGSESIFELAIIVGESDLTTSSLGFYLRRRGHGSTSAMGQFVASDYFIERLAKDPQDVRHGVMSNDILSPTRMGACYKYSGSVNLEGDGKGNSSAVNIKIIRLSEIYLIAAEAALGTNNKEKAASFLNSIRKRAPNLTPATAANIDLDMIADEKSKELFAEGQRFFDMIRWNKRITFNDESMVGAVVITHRDKTIDRNFYKIVLPISVAETDANPALRSQQNPGY